MGRAARMAWPRDAGARHTEIGRPGWIMAMCDGLRLYWLYVKLSIRAQLQYRAAFLLAALGQFLITGVEFLGVWALFDRFGRLHSWSLPEVAVFYGLVNCTFACADALSRGFDQFGTLYIKTEIGRA